MNGIFQLNPFFADVSLTCPKTVLTPTYPVGIIETELINIMIVKDMIIISPDINLGSFSYQ